MFLLTARRVFSTQAAKFLFWPGLGLYCALQALAACAADFILDPGHSPGSPGARSCSGVYEYVYNDALAAETAKYLSAKGLAADITRKPVENMKLAERAALSAGKKLFLSIHHDSVQPRFIESVNGAPCSRKAEGYSIFISSKNPFYQQSWAYAWLLGRALHKRGFRPSTHHGENIAGENRPLLDARYGIYLFDDLVALKQARSPALLLEAAVIVNPEDEKRAVSPAYKAAMADAIAEMLAAAESASPGR